MRDRCNHRPVEREVSNVGAVWEAASSADVALPLPLADPVNFADFYDREATIVLRWFLRRTTSLDWAAELTAETFAQAFLSAGRYRADRGTTRAWVLGIAKHVLLRSLRRERVDERARRRLGVEPVMLPDVALERAEELVDLDAQRPLLDAALGDLSPAVRAAVELRVGEGLPFDEVAQRLGCTPNAARVRVTRGMQQLIARMEQR
jgi:RNA polymerase sigma-70 factor (ECF subfamily)